MAKNTSGLSRSVLWILILAALAVIGLTLFPHYAHAKSLAVVVLVDTYDNKRILGLPKIESDQVGEVNQALITANYNEVIRLTNPTKAEVEILFFQTLPAKLARGDTLVIYFASRGAGGDSNEPYLLSRDTNPDDIEGSGVKVEGLLNSVSHANVIILSNTTQSGDFGNVAFIGPKSKHWADQVSSAFVLSIMPLSNDVVWLNFGRTIVNGLGHPADASNDGNITLAEFRRYFESQIGWATNDLVRVDVAGDYDPTKIISTAPKVMDMPKISMTESQKIRRGFGKLLFGSGGGLLLTSGSLYFVGQSELKNLDSDNSSMYETIRAFQIATGVTGCTLVAVGAGLWAIQF